MAEREGFEPSVPRKEDNGFRDRPVRPLRHLSVLSYMGRARRRRDPRRARTLAKGRTTRNRGRLVRASLAVAHDRVTAQQTNERLPFPAVDLRALGFLR